MTGRGQSSEAAAAGPVVTAAAAEVETEFFDALVPPLNAGSYVLRVEQDVDGDGVAARYRHEQPIRVTGPHFGLAPGSVFGMHPPAGGTADFADALPSIVLSDAALPWAIDPRPGNAADPRPGDAAAQQPSWIALLLLTMDEILVPPQPGEAGPTGAHTVALADYLTPPQGAIGPVFTPAEQLRFLEENPPERTVSVVDVDADAFRALAPRPEELGLLAHARSVDPADLADAEAEAGSSVSVVVGTRLVRGAADGVYAAHLVSVEGFTGHLAPDALPAEAGAVRLISLANWTFTDVPSGLDFPAAMRGLDVARLRLPDVFPEPRGDGERAVTRNLALGYTAAEYRTRLGERTVGWYRGPCLPVRMKRNPQPPYRSADAALVYDPETGMFDVSFAVAWQTGRLVALSDRELVVALLRWLTGYQRAGHLLLERAELHRSLGGTTTGDGPPRRSTSRGTVMAELSSLLAQLPTGVEGAGVFGPPIDPSGLLAHLVRMPGVVHPDDAAGAAGSGDPTAAVIAAVRGGREQS